MHSCNVQGVLEWKLNVNICCEFVAFRRFLQGFFKSAVLAIRAFFGSGDVRHVTDFKMTRPPVVKFDATGPLNRPASRFPRSLVNL
jgi:hypothetical protein